MTSNIKKPNAVLVLDGNVFVIWFLNKHRKSDII
jgi:hypothetical protein